MTLPYAPATVLPEPGRSVGGRMGRVFLKESGTDALTGGPNFVLDTETETDCFTLSGTDVKINDDPAAAGALKIIMVGSTAKLYT